MTVENQDLEAEQYQQQLEEKRVERDRKYTRIHMSLMRFYQTSTNFTEQERTDFNQRLTNRNTIRGQLAEFMFLDGERRDKLFNGVVVNELEEVSSEMENLPDFESDRGDFDIISDSFFLRAYINGRIEASRYQEEQQKLQQEARQERVRNKLKKLKLTEREEIIANTLAPATIDNPITSVRISRIASATMDDHFGRGDITNIFQRLRPKLEEEGLILLKRTSKEDKTGYFLVELDPKVNQ